MKTALSDRAVFLDRDGTIIEDMGYLGDPGGVKLMPGAAGAIARLRAAGLKIIVVSNQSGIARGYITADDVGRVNARLDELLGGRGAAVDAYYFCPHHPRYGEMLDCGCRKPRPGMATRAAAEHGVSLEISYFVGDKAADVLAGIAAGSKAALVLTGYGRDEKEKLEAGGVGPYMVFDGLPDAADWIIKDLKGS